MNKNRKILITTLLIMSVLALIIGSTLAYWTWSSNNLVTVNITTSMGGIGLTLNGGTTAINNLAPASCTHSTYANMIPVTISRYNETGNPATADLTLSVTSFTWVNAKPVANDLQYINVAITSSSSSCSNPIASGNLANITVNNSVSTAQTQNTGVMTWNYVLPATSGTQSVPIQETYYLYVWLSSEYTYENNGSNTITDPLQDISFTLTWNASSIDQVESLASTSLYRYIESNADAITTIDFSTTVGTGVFRLLSTASDTYPVYYYRGAVTDNNVFFANKCWKIVRTTSTGGVKLIYNGLNTGTSEAPACDNTGTDSQIGTSAFNPGRISPSDVGYMYGARYARSSATGTDWYYAPDVSYSNGTYTLTSKEIDNVTYNVESKADITGTNLDYHHYTCGSNTDTTCSEVRYVYYVKSDNSTVYYITLSDGKKVEDAISEMLTNSTDENDSTIKAYIDDWYSDSTKGNMTGYTQYLEDTIWCNDRSILTLGAFNPDGGGIGYHLFFGLFGRQFSIISTCPNKHDAFTVNDVMKGNGKLTYPIGLITGDEFIMANPSSISYLTTGEPYWSGTPYNFREGLAFEWFVSDSGSLSITYVVVSIGVRPLVSLKPNTRISSGTGTIADPLIIATN